MSVVWGSVFHHDASRIRWIFPGLMRFAPVILAGMGMATASAEPGEKDAGKGAQIAEEVLQVTRDYNAAWETLDPERISAFHSEDFHYYWRGARHASSRAEYDHLLREQIIPATSKWSAEMIEPAVQVMGPDSATVSFEFESETAPYEYGPGALSYVFRRTDGAWKIVLIHESAPVPVPQNEPQQEQ